MFDKLKERVRHWMQKTGAETGLAKEFKDIFEVGGVPALDVYKRQRVYRPHRFSPGLYKKAA